MAKKDSSNIIDSLTNLKSVLDDVFGPMRTLIGERSKTMTGYWWLLKPFYQGLTNFKLSMRLNDIGKTVIDIASSPYLLLLFGVGFFSLKSDTFKSGFKEGLRTLIVTHTDLILIGLLVAYLLGVVIHFHRLTKFGDQYFDIRAFKLFQPTLYKMFLKYNESPSFSFEVLHEHFKSFSITSEENQKDLIQMLKERDSKIREQDQERKREEIVYKTTIRRLEKSINSFEQMEHLFFLATQSLLRLSKNQFSEEDLVVKSAYSLFRLEDERLIKIASHKNVNTPSVINLRDTQHQDWAMIKILQTDTNGTVLDINEEHNRIIASRKFRIEGYVYVYNFHFQETDLDSYVTIDERAMEQLLYSLIYTYHQLTVGRVGNRHDSIHRYS